MKAMETLQDLIEEAKVRTLWWAICIFGIAYFLSHKKMRYNRNAEAITPDKEAPDQVHMLIKDVIGEISGRIKQINLVDLLTRDMVDLIGDHLDIYKRNQSSIGVDVMGTLSSEERDERLRYHLIASKELHPALFSSECPSEAYGRGLGCCLKTKRG
ncbi:hypothetical protein MRB53_006339 [Persea americana]|uniref:Uncharacterized protein n=1 Tax=Persea americana TaxID=3435 RepID=A0ACC2MFP5_PERAE|nr:hypothetical protein MRB53_006339 [Persea americana]